MRVSVTGNHVTPFPSHQSLDPFLFESYLQRGQDVAALRSGPLQPEDHLNIFSVLTHLRCLLLATVREAGDVAEPATVANTQLGLPVAVLILTVGEKTAARQRGSTWEGRGNTVRG
ncbi:hypothetical protein Vretifemale_559 [Volvox reticuliferus]|uniref:Uncharacterized protein n=1 Tax=Volvox reticuliferus TaxID=1737510 RepID=A0A8J4FCQ6_9CHLO|nr:hypothetical protein Vretifemale_559 [Volvox reticuliferus]